MNDLSSFMLLLGILFCIIVVGVGFFYFRSEIRREIRALRDEVERLKGSR